MFSLNSYHFVTSILIGSLACNQFSLWSLKQDILGSKVLCRWIADNSKSILDNDHSFNPVVVVEVFFLGKDDKYLEVELSPYVFFVY